MGDWKKTIWRVPLICLITGLLWMPVMVRLLLRFAIVKLPDGTISSDTGRQLMVYGAAMAAVLAIGGYFLRRFTRREIFCSASLVVAYSLLLLLAQWWSGITTGPGALVFARLYTAVEWCSFPGMVLREMFPGDWSLNYLYLSSLADCFVPWLFVLFGKKSMQHPD